MEISEDGAKIPKRPVRRNELADGGDGWMDGWIARFPSRLVSKLLEMATFASTARCPVGTPV